VMKREADLHDKKDALVERKCCQIASRRRAHTTLDPDNECQDVAWNTDDIPDWSDVEVYCVDRRPPEQCWIWQ